MWVWEERNMLGKWSEVRSDEPPNVGSNGRIKKAEGQGALVRNVRLSEPKEETPE